MRIVVYTIAILLMAAPSFSTIILVPGDQPTIQAGIDAAANGDTIMVGDGIYSECIAIAKSIVLTSEIGYANARILPDDSGAPIITVTGSAVEDCTIRGFTFQNALNGAIRVQETVPPIAITITDNYFENNYASGGGAIYCHSTNALISHNIFANSSAGNFGGSAIKLAGVNGDNKIARNLFMDDNGPFTVAVDGGTVSIINNTFNRCLQGVLAVYTSEARILNDIITNSTEKYGYGLIYFGGWTGQLIDYNDFWNNRNNYDPGPNGISADPLYLDRDNHDFSLRIASPCIDAGHPDDQYFDPDGTRSDIGAYPLKIVYPIPDHINYGPASSGDTVTTATPEIFWTYADTSATSQAGYEIEVGLDTDWTTAELWATGPVMSSDTQALYSAIPLEDHQSYYLRLRVSDGIDWGEWRPALIIAEITRVVNIPGDYPTIQDGINNAEHGDTVLVHPGRYIENINFKGKRIVLLSTHGRDSTVIEGGTAGGTVVRFSSGEDTTSIVDGFTIKNPDYGRGINCYRSSPIIRNCDVCSCYTNSDGAGIWCEYSGAKIRHNRIYDNSTGPYYCTGGGLWLTGNSDQTLEVSYNEIYNNKATNGDGISMWAGNARIYRNIIRDHTDVGTYPGGIYVAETMTGEILNNTIINNRAGIVFNTNFGDSVVIMNNIVAWNTAAGISCGEAFSDYNNVWKNGDHNLPGPNGISADPLFVDPDANDFRLMEESPCIDAGNPLPEYNDVDCSRNDIGALLRYHVLPIAVNINYGRGPLDNVVASLTPSVYWTYFDTLATEQNQYEIEIGTDNDWSVAELWKTGPVTSSDTVAGYGGSPLDDRNTYFVRIRVSGEYGWGNWRRSNFYIKLSNILHVPAEYLLIQEAIGKALDGDTICVGPGTYVENIDFRGKNILLSGQEDPANTIIRPAISWKSTVTISNGENQGAELNGITVADGSCDQAVDIGNGAYPKIDNCIFYGYVPAKNDVGVVIRVHSGVELSHNLFYDNGGISCIGVDDSGSAMIINNTFDHNRRGFHTLSPNVVARNNIVTNSADYGVYGLFAELSYNCLWNNNPDYDGGAVPGNGSLSVDPLYQDASLYDYRLDSHSPCINSGAPDSLYTDPDGSRSDMGAYYYPYNPSGDANGDAHLDISDVVYLIGYIFRDGPAPVPLSSGDANCDGIISIGDAVYIVCFLYRDCQRPDCP